MKSLSVVVGVSLAISAMPALAQMINGAGATFPAPVYAKWADSYHKKTGVKLNYQSIGSGGGVKQIIAKTVDFGASDDPMKPEDLAKNGLVQFPTVIGGVVPVANLDGVNSGQVKLTPDLLVKMYSGKITRWDDSAVKAINPGLPLSGPITVVYRADGSGTTAVFTDYLSKVDQTWKITVGQGKTVKWPVGLGGKGNEGVAQQVRQIKGALGYVEYAYAKKNGLDTINLQNKAGTFVKASPKAFAAAASSVNWPVAAKNAFVVDMNNTSGKDAWPITSATYILMHAKQAKPEVGKQVLQFFDWALTDGGAEAAALDYVPLPKVAVDAVKASWSLIE